MQLVERDDALRQLLEKFELTRDDGHGHVAVIESPSGTGKTALLSTFAELLSEKNAVVLGAFGSDAQQGVPASVLTRLLSSSVADESITRRLDEMLDEIGSARFVSDSPRRNPISVDSCSPTR